MAHSSASLAAAKAVWAGLFQMEELQRMNVAVEFMQTNFNNAFIISELQAPRLWAFIYSLSTLPQYRRRWQTVH